MKVNFQGLVFAAACALLCALQSSTQAGEPAEEFLQALRSRGYFEMAIEYLDQIERSPLVPPSFRETVLFEKGVTQIAAARVERDSVRRARQLDQAQQVLQQFVNERATNPKVNAAKMELGNVVVVRANMRVENAGEQSNAAKKKTLLGEARTMYDQAEKLFADLQEEIRKELEGIPKVLPSDDPRGKRRTQLRADLLQAKLMEAAIIEEKAETAPEGSQPYKTLLLKAAGKYEKMYADYRSRIAGLYARMYQGRCHLKAGSHKDALSYFGDLLAQPNEPEFRRLKKETLLLATQIWLVGDTPKYMAAIENLEPLIDSLTQFEQREPDWLRLQLALAKAHKFRMDDLEEVTPRPDEYKISAKAGARLVQLLSRTRSVVQEEAQALALAFNVRVGKSGISEPTTFAEAMEAGRAAMDLMKVASQRTAEINEKLKTVKDEKEKEKLQAELDSVKNASSNAMRYFKLALELADDETPIADINVAQYYLAYFYYAAGDMYGAAVLGEFIARRYPDSSGARQCAMIAMTCYLQLYRQNKSGDRSFEKQQATSICEMMLDYWPEEPEAVDAANTLIAFMLQDDNPAKAVEYLTRIPSESDHRGKAELQTGQAIWSKYLRGMQKARKLEDEAGKQAAITELEPFKVMAEKTLADGIARMRQAGSVDETMATAVLSLAQIYVDTNQPAKALELCEDPDIGVLTLVRNKHVVNEKEGFTVESYRTALRSYVSSLAATEDPDAMIAKARGIMGELKKAMGSDADGEKKLVQFYVVLAQRLKKQVENAEPAARAALSKGFETFLKQVGADSNELNILNMVAESFYSLGAGLDTTGPANRKLPAEAARYYKEAISAFSKILKKGDADPSWLPAARRSEVNFRLATAERALGDHLGAVEKYAKILTEKNMSLNVQVEAARSYQMWAAVDKENPPLLYTRAMQGSRKDEREKIKGEKNPNFRKNIIWGWGRISKITQRYPQYSEIFFDARYNLALCRYKFADLKTSPADKKRYFEMAKGDIEMTYRLYPELGGPAWKKKFDSLMKDIQRKLGKKPVGLLASN